MPKKPLTMLDILKHLDKSNCGRCGLPTCTAFAAMAARGQKDLNACPLLHADLVQELNRGVAAGTDQTGGFRGERLERLKEAFRETDLEDAARRTGGTVIGGRLSLQVMGKRFELGPGGELYSECHVNPWVHLPLLAYAAHGAGRPLANRWVAFRDLKQARDWERFFNHRCEKGIQQIVDQDPDFFFDAMSLFSPARARDTAGEAFSGADDVILVRPMPKLPMLLAYWRAEGAFGSKLTLFFDASAEANLGAEFIYLLTTGILEMFKRIFSTHGL